MARAETAVWRNNDRVFLQPRENTVFPRKISAKQARPNDLRIPFTSSLRWKVALSFSVVLMLVVAFLFAGFMWYERVFLFQETQKRAKSLVNNLVINARDPLLSQDDLRLGPIIASISQDPEVQSAYLLDLQGRVLYHSDSRRTGRWLIDGVPSPDKGIIQASMPIEVENVKVGTAVVGLGVDHIDQAMMKTAMGLLLPLGLGVGLGILGIFLPCRHSRRSDQKVGRGGPGLGFRRSSCPC